MSSKNLPRFVATLALAVSLALLPAAAHARPQSGAAGGPRSLTTDVLDTLAQLWSGLVRAWGEEGIMIDPNGNTSSSEGDNDAGMMIDPDGNSSEEDGDNGMTIDPNG